MKHEDLEKKAQEEFRSRGKNPISQQLTNVYLESETFRLIIDGMIVNITDDNHAQDFLNDIKTMLYGYY